MAIFSDGFESGDFTAWTSTEGTPAIVPSPVHHGTYAAQMNASGDYLEKEIAEQTILYYRCYVRFNNLQANNNSNRFDILDVLTASEEIACVEAFKNKWVLEYHTGAGWFSIDWVSAPVINTWYCVELKIVISATVGEFTVYIDGVSRMSATGLDSNNFGNAIRVFLAYKNNDEPLTVTFDCVVVDSSYIGPEAAGVTVKKGSNLSARMTEMLNSKMLFSIADRFPKLVPRRF